MFEAVNNPTGPKWKRPLFTAAIGLTFMAGVIWIFHMTYMPLRSFSGPLPPLTNEQSELARHLSSHVRYLSETIGERSMAQAGSLQMTAKYLRNKLEEAGYKVTDNSYSVGHQEINNVEARLAGSVDEMVVVGAHYDSVPGTTGANDNGSGVAGVLELARMLQGTKPNKTICFVFFVNEEPPYFQTKEMGSVVYARHLKQERVKVSAMLALETIGYYSDAPGSQRYPGGLGALYPSLGNFIGFVGNPASHDLVQRSIRAFRESTKFPSEGVAAPAEWAGVGWSDHWSFWQEGYSAIMMTDTAPFRYQLYHTPHDTLDKIDFEKMARVVEGAKHVVEALAKDQ